MILTGKTKVKLVVDLVMTVLLLCQMAYMMIGEAAHEWIGTSMFVLFILHHVLNGKWHRNLIKGRYSGLRIAQTAVGVLMLAAMIGLMLSGIMMSRYVFSFLSIEGSISFARTLHMLASYWGFLLMSIHLGLHWSMILGMARKMRGEKKTSRAGIFLLRLAAAAVSAYGIFAFVKHDLASYLFLKTEFVFFDMSQPLLLFLSEYAAMMGLFVCLAYYGEKLLRRLGQRK